MDLVEGFLYDIDITGYAEFNLDRVPDVYNRAIGMSKEAFLALWVSSGLPDGSRKPIKMQAKPQGSGDAAEEEDDVEAPEEPFIDDDSARLSWPLIFDCLPTPLLL